MSLDFNAKIGYVSRAIGRCIGDLVDFSLVVLLVFFTLGYLLLYLVGTFMPPGGPIAVGEESDAVVYLLLNYITPGPRPRPRIADRRASSRPASYLSQAKPL